MIKQNTLSKYESGDHDVPTDVLSVRSSNRSANKQIPVSKESFTLAANEKRCEAYELEQRALRITDDEVAFAK